PTVKLTFVAPTLRACASASAITSAETSTASTSPGATRAAGSAFRVPGPHPTSRRLIPRRRWGMRYPAEFSAVRHRWERTTASWWPWVWVSAAWLIGHAVTAGGVGTAPHGRGGERRLD